MKRSVFLFIFMCLFSCNQELNEQEETVSEVELLFPNFPDQPFLNINFESLTLDVFDVLKRQNYQEKQNQVNHYINEVDNIVVIIPESEKLGNFKIFFFDKNEQFLDDLDHFFTKRAKKTSKKVTSQEFTYYEFDTYKHNFTATIFEMENALRINFNLIKKH